MGTQAEPGGTTEDFVLDGRVRLIQPRSGYRAGMDAALLAAAIDAKPGERALEAGCGAGGALLAAATRRAEAGFLGVERDPDAAALGQGNVVLNGLGARVRIVEGDVRAPFAQLNEPAFDLAFANPPFFDDPDALRGPAPERRGAWLADGGLAAWTGFLLSAVRDGGGVMLIHRADRLADLLGLLSARAGSIAVRPIHAYAEQPAKRVLVRAVKGGRAPLRLLPPLVLHDRSGAKHTAEAEAILRGEAALTWS